MDLGAQYTMYILDEDLFQKANSLLFFFPSVFGHLADMTFKYKQVLCMFAHAQCCFSALGDTAKGLTRLSCIWHQY